MREIKIVILSILMICTIWETKPQESTPSNVDYTPDIFGAMLATYSISGYNALSQFSVRNFRFGVRGNASRDVNYRVQVDFNNQGSISILDSYVQYVRPKYDITIGQQHIQLSEDMMRGPRRNVFYSNSLASTYILSYSVDGEGVGSMTSRDIGIYGQYLLDDICPIPISLGAGLFNGTGANNPEYDRKVNFSGRIMAGDLTEGVSGGASVYIGQNPLDQDLIITTAELRYTKERCMVEGLYQHRKITDVEADYANVASVIGHYSFLLPESKNFQSIQPALRWDMSDNMNYSVTTVEGDKDGLCNLNVQRITTQVNLHLRGEKIRSRLCVGYEKFFRSENPDDIEWNTLLHDKFTVAVNIGF